MNDEILVKLRQAHRDTAMARAKMVNTGNPDWVRLFKTECVLAHLISLWEADNEEL